MKFGLPETTLECIQDYFAKVPAIEKVIIYGSRAKGNFKKGSDIDLAFIASGKENLTGRLLTELDELPTPYLFDVTDYNQLQHQELKAHINRVGKIFYERR